MYDEKTSRETSWFTGISGMAKNNETIKLGWLRGWDNYCMQNFDKGTSCKKYIHTLI
jgi:hypothetical protein